MASEDEEDVLSFGSEEGQNGDADEDAQHENAEVRHGGELHLDVGGDPHSLRIHPSHEYCLPKYGYLWLMLCRTETMPMMVLSMMRLRNSLRGQQQQMAAH
jgi:hypothetical protein